MPATGGAEAERARPPTGESSFRPLTIAKRGRCRPTSCPWSISAAS